MNLIDIASVQAPPPISAYVCWGLGAAFVLVAIVLAVRVEGGVRDKLSAAGVALVCTAALTLVGFVISDTSTTVAQESAFEQKLQSEYNMTTSDSLFRVKAAANNKATIEVRHGDDLIEVRPFIAADTLTFHHTDGTLIDPSGR